MTLAKQPTNNETKEEIIKKNFIFFLKEIFETKSNKWIGKIDKISELITIGKVVKQLEEECIKYEITIIKSKTNTTPAINYCITVCKKKNEYYTTVTDVSTQITGYLYELYSNKDVTNNTNEICKANKPRKTRKTRKTNETNKTNKICNTINDSDFINMFVIPGKKNKTHYDFLTGNTSKTQTTTIPHSYSVYSPLTNVAKVTGTVLQTVCTIV